MCPPDTYNDMSNTWQWTHKWNRYKLLYLKTIVNRSFKRVSIILDKVDAVQLPAVYTWYRIKQQESQFEWESKVGGIFVTWMLRCCHHQRSESLTHPSVERVTGDFPHKIARRKMFPCLDVIHRSSRHTHVHTCVHQYACNCCRSNNIDQK